MLIWLRAMASALLPRDVKKALELLEGDPARARALGELAATCGVAPRTLQKHFRRFVARTPLGLQRELRFEGARRELLHASAGTRVTAVALRWGFAHLGRFAVQYRRRYGESPSATLQRGLAAPVPLPMPPRLGRPTLAVLPFERRGAAARRASALGEEIAATLSRLRWIAVVPAAAAAYRLCGRIDDDGQGRLRVSAFLVEAAGGGTVWAEHWSGAADDAPAFEAQAAQRVARALQPALRGCEIERASRADPAALNAWELSMRALPCALALEPDAATRALELLEQAMALAPPDALPLALAAWCHGVRAGHHFTSHPERERVRARALAARAAALDSGDPLVEALLAAGYTLAHDLDAASVHVERALLLDGGSAWAWGRSGWLMVYRGRPQEAIEQLQIARRLAPGDRLGFLHAIGIGAAHFHAARYGEAIRWYQRALAERPSALWNDRFRAAAYALAGRKEEARQTLAAFARRYPDLTIAQVRQGLPYAPQFLERVAEGLESAGMRP